MDGQHPLLGFLKETLQTALISLGIFMVVYLFVMQPHRIKGESMMPNFESGELLLTEKVSYYLSDIKRGDVVVFRAPNYKNVDFIKRVIALPGETVRIEDGEVFINDKKLDEPYETQETQGIVSAKLSTGQYFVLGDNRGSSSDSRSFGSIEKKSIKGRAFLVYFPLFKTNGSHGARLVSRAHYGVSNSLDNR